MKRTLAVTVLLLCAATASGAPPAPFTGYCAANKKEIGADAFDIAWDGKKVQFKSKSLFGSFVWSGTGETITDTTGTNGKRVETYSFRADPLDLPNYKTSLRHLSVAIIYEKDGSIAGITAKRATMLDGFLSDSYEIHGLICGKIREVFIP